MRYRTVRGLMALAAILALASCAGGDEGLRTLSSPSNGPDEFSVVPVRPLQIPASRALPVPTPGAGNLADANPIGDAVVALGGRPSAAVAGGIPAGDAALIAAASRNGVAPDIRSVLASEDASFRGRAAFLSGLNPFVSDRYFRAYAGQSLDAQAEIDRFRNLGIGVPSSPPAD